MSVVAPKQHLHADAHLVVDDLTVEYRTRRWRVQAVSGISFDIKRGETLGLVGESGCGKSTTGRAILHLPPPTSGRVCLDDKEITAMTEEQRRVTRRNLQMIFQDPISSINPRRRIGDVVAEPLRVWGVPREERPHLVDEALLRVGLDPTVARSKLRHEFSGGQCQRICIARALVMAPEVLICDEPVSSLDVSVQAQILNLLEDLKDQFGLTMLFIAHDLAVVKNVSDRVAVMYLGKICEIAPSEQLYREAAHHYTAALLSAIPKHGAQRTSRPVVLSGDPPTPIAPPSGCRFRTRCPRAEDRCAAEEPVLRRVADDHFVACHFPLVPVGN